MKQMNTPFLETLFDKMVDAVYLIDPVSSNILWCNRAGWEDLCLNRGEVINHSVLSLQKDVTGLPQWAEVAEVVKNSKEFTFVGRHTKKDGSEFPVEVNTSFFEFEDEGFFLSIARNVTKRVSLEKDLQEKQNRMWFALNEASDGIWEWNLIDDSVFFSPQLKKMLGYGPDEMQPVIETWSNNVHPDDLERVIAILMNHIKGFREKYEAEYRLKNRNGHYIWVHDKGIVCARDEDGEPTHAVGMVQNITDQKNLQFQLEQLAANDMLTDLPNRRKGEEVAKQQMALAIRTDTPLSILAIDLDHFKAINDLFGHQKGDEALKFSAEIFRNAIRASDYIYRWGGEEFVIILPATDILQAHKVAENVHQVTAAADWQSQRLQPQTLSIGIATYPQHGKAFDVLLKHADAALYLAKEQGRNQTCIASMDD